MYVKRPLSERPLSGLGAVAARTSTGRTRVVAAPRPTPPRQPAVFAPPLSVAVKADRYLPATMPTRTPATSWVPATNPRGPRPQAFQPAGNRVMKAPLAATFTAWTPAIVAATPSVSSSTTGGSYGGGGSAARTGGAGGGSSEDEFEVPEDAPDSSEFSDSKAKAFPTKAVAIVGVGLGGLYLYLRSKKKG